MTQNQNTAPKRAAKSKLHLAIYAGMAAIVVFGLGVTFGARTTLDYSSVDQAYKILSTNFDGKLDTAKLHDGLKTGLAEATGDPYTQYFSAKDAKAFENQLEGKISGIGAELGQNAAGNLVVVSRFDGSPAAGAGLRSQDIIAAINNQATSGMSIDQAVSKIRGAKGTKVALKIIRGQSEQWQLTITRDDIKIPSVKTEILASNIGYMQIRQFGDDTASLARTAAQDFKAKQVKGVVLDLRNDPGGFLDAAVDVSSLWLPKGNVVVQEKQGNVVKKTHTSDGNDILKGMPTVVLINEGSASAAEITAGALRDNNAAKLIGQKSYGKGSVQEVFDLSGGAELKVTVNRWYRPNGQNIDKKGIAPDTNVKMTEDDFQNASDPQKDAALQQLLH